MVYEPQGVCSKAIDVEVEEGVIKSVKFTGGCNGNLQGISSLVAGPYPAVSLICLSSTLFFNSEICLFVYSGKCPAAISRISNPNFAAFST